MLVISWTDELFVPVMIMFGKGKTQLLASFSQIKIITIKKTCVDWPSSGGSVSLGSALSGSPLAAFGTPVLIFFMIISLEEFLSYSVNPCKTTFKDSAHSISTFCKDFCNIWWNQLRAPRFCWQRYDLWVGFKLKSFDVNIQYDKYGWQKKPVLSVTTKTNRAPRPKGTRVRRLNSLKFSSKRSTGKLCYGLKRKRKHSVIQKPKINTRKCEKY